MPKKAKEKVEEPEPQEKVEAIVEEPEKIVVEAPPEVVEAPVDVEEQSVIEVKTDVEGWKPKTSIGKQVKSGELTDIDSILNSGQKILEAEIVDALLPNIKHELLMVGQSKGKFGGGARRIFKQTQKKTPEGNKPSFGCYAVVGNDNGYIGYGQGKSKDTVPSREKALRKAKLNVFKIRRGCGSWECGCKEPHSIPFKVEGKCGSVWIKIMPAPKGKGLCIEPECAKILKLAGIKDVWSKSSGQSRTKTNMLIACIQALQKLIKLKVNPQIIENLGLIEGKIKVEAST